MFQEIVVCCFQGLRELASGPNSVHWKVTGRGYLWLEQAVCICSWNRSGNWGNWSGNWGNWGKRELAKGQCSVHWKDSHSLMSCVSAAETGLVNSSRATYWYQDCVYICTQSRILSKCWVSVSSVHQSFALRCVGEKLVYWDVTVHYGARLELHCKPFRGKDFDAPCLCLSLFDGKWRVKVSLA